MEIKKWPFLFLGFFLFTSSDCNKTPEKDSNDLRGGSSDNIVDLSINKDLFSQSASHMFQVVKEPGEELEEKLKKLKIPVLRFPGGTGSNYYHFYENGYGFNEKDILLSKGYPPYEKMMVRLFREEKFIKSGFATENYSIRFAKLAEELNSAVLLVLNIFSGSDDENLDLVRFFSEKGIRIKGIEFGNENYFRSFGSQFPDAKEYIKRCKQLTSKLKQEFPGLPVAVTAANCPFDTHLGLKSRFNDWNADLATEDFYDAVVVHFYVKTPECDKIQDLDEKFECAKLKCLNDSRKWIDEGLDYYSNVFQDKGVWLTEYNILEVYRQYGNTALQGLYTANFLIDLAKNNKVDMAVYHVLFTNSFGFAMLSNLKDEPKERVSYRIFDLFSEIDSTYNIVEISDLNGQIDRANTLVLYSEAHSKHLIYMVNFENKKLSFKLPERIQGSDLLHSSVHSDKLYGSLGKNAFTRSEDSESVYSHSKKIMNNTIELKPYSFSLLVIE